MNRYNAAALILQGPLLRYKCADFVHPASERSESSWIDIDPILDDYGSWSHGEQLMVDLAADLYESGHAVSMGELCNVLDERNWKLAMRAIAMRRAG